ncbi:hypothetical protein [Pelomonas sp. Root1444]|uniref:hypothetical protein n=1 Tax=Pelomonas sp. Root1444 TaxID=1736464 RepID=UPI000702563D|nr:hypothetical protein [Pelomonas sp. Root1444]KQY83664.1 hypothetical protein ASD35_24380 [Pelomonas sp. Root1444]
MVFPVPRTRIQLTGRTRGRPQAITGKIVMQVEEVVEQSTMFICPPPPWCKTREEAQKWRDDELAQFDQSWRRVRVQWRDATLVDLVSEQVLLAAR